MMVLKWNLMRDRCVKRACLFHYCSLVNYIACFLTFPLFLPPSLYFSLTHPLSLQRYKAELLLISKHVIFCIFFKDFFSSQKGYPHPPIFLTRYFPLPALKCQHSVKDARRIHLGFRRYISRSMLYTSN